MILDEIDRTAREAVAKAGALILENIGRTALFTIGTKGPSDYVTDVDRASEALIVETVRERFPDHHIMAEESDGAWGDADKYTWVIDPIDGTMNFIHGFPFVAVSVGICIGGEPVLGYVLDPVRQELFHAKKGGGAFLNGVPIRCREGVELSEALIATGFPHRSKEVFESYLRVFREVFYGTSGIRRAGAAALDLAYLAAGRVDGFWETGLKPWDVAAGSLLCAEAGAVVSDYWGGSNHIYNGHIVGGTPAVYPFLYEWVHTHLAPALTGS